MKLFTLVFLTLCIAVSLKSFCKKFLCWNFGDLLQLANAMFNSENMIHMPYYAYVTFSSVQMTFYGGGALISSTHVLTSGANTQG